MKNKVQKMEVIQDKIEHLKAKQNEIEHELSHNFVQVLKASNAFQIDFDAMIGGILETINTIRSDPGKLESWRLVGSKFRKSRIPSKQKKTKNVNVKLETEYV